MKCQFAMTLKVTNLRTWQVPTLSPEEASVQAQEMLRTGARPEVGRRVGG